MNTIAKNKFYEIAVDQSKNRIYFKIIGFWQSPDVVPNYLNDIKKASKEVTPGYTILSDLKEMKTPPQEVGELHKYAQTVLVTAGLRKTAEIVESAVLGMALSNYAKASNMNKKPFSSLVEAENWLNQI